MEECGSSVVPGLAQMSRRVQQRNVTGPSRPLRQKQMGRMLEQGLMKMSNHKDRIEGHP